jgi:hypothetical protein
MAHRPAREAPGGPRPRRVRWGTLAVTAGLVGLPLWLTGCDPMDADPAATLGGSVVVGPGGIGEVGAPGDGGGVVVVGDGFQPPAPPAPPRPPWMPAIPAWTAFGPVPGTARTAATATSPSSPGLTPSASPALAKGPCLPLYGPGTPVPVTVSTRSGRATMTWWHNGDPAALAYWVGVRVLRRDPATSSPTTSPTSTGTPTSTSTSSPAGTATPTATSTGPPAEPTVWYRLIPPSGCRTLTFTVPGLSRKVSYVLLLDLEGWVPETASGSRRLPLDQVPGVRLP